MPIVNPATSKSHLIARVTPLTVSNDQTDFLACNLAYNKLESYWEKLAEIFPRARNNKLPTCVFINPNNIPSRSCPERGLIFMPQKPDKETVFEVCELICTEVQERCWTPTAYTGELNILLFNLNRIENEGALTEEVTHAATALPNSCVRVNKDVIESFDGYSPRLGKKLLSQLQNCCPDEFVLGINEFFVPLGQSALLVDSEARLSEGINEVLSSSSSPYGVYDFIYHIPQLAGLLLLQQYNGDVNTVISSHPEILTLDANGIWEQFCLPLLTHGKLDK